ncbi:S24 family peptidase [Enterococcus devriesei]|uniref:LexA family protein n=1 Tax=Enterococcus devriesei TaxID=319970 RepID=UPI0028AF1DDD|nr:S24 family peptidase [Enterococcus devriesei]
MSNLFGISIDQLLDQKDFNNEIKISGTIPEENTIPILGRITASAPSGLVSDYEGEISIQPSTIKRYGRKGIFALRVLGDSMSRVIPDSAIAIVHKTCEWEDGDICAVTINGDDTTLKQVFHTERGIKFTPLSYSKFHAPWEYIKDEDEVDVMIHGVFLYGIILTDKM